MGELSRAPIVAILGHVDHGKTTLLDYIRATHVADREAGGITQSIGAYQAVFQDKKLTFIDTPGHAAFSKMRSQGASTADIAVLVVAADDSVQPQTVESIKHIKAAKIPYVVAINKIDKPDANPEVVKAKLTEHEVFVEGYGGNVPFVLISGKTGKGVDSLLETILLLAELEDIPYQPDAPLLAPIIEAKLDPKRGILASAIVKMGRITVGSDVEIAKQVSKVRAIIGDLGQSLSEATPGMPVQLLGLGQLPKVGEVIGDVGKTEATTVTEDVVAAESPEKQLKVIIKADTVGSLEAILGSLTAEVKVVMGGTGEINEGDVLLAATTGSIVLGFNARVGSSVVKLAETEKVVVKSYRIIYELLEYLEKKVLKMMESTIDEDELGKATIIKVFEINGEKIAGARVESGRFEIGDTIHLQKNDGTVKDAKVKSLRIMRAEVKKVPAGTECGILLFPNLDLREKEAIISYRKHTEDI